MSELLEALPRLQDAGKPEWVWYSNGTSTEKGVFSVLAAFEVLLAVTAYWAIAFWTHTHVHLLIGVIVAPVLLLRSDQSTQLGSRWFSDFDIYYNADKGWIALRVNKIYKYLWTRRLFNRGSTRTKIIAVIFSIFILACFVAASFISIFLIRLVATARYIIPGIASISQNWWRTLFATDLASPPEIMPGYENHKSMFSYRSSLETITELYNGIKREHGAVRVILISFIPLTLLHFIIFIGPSYIYRMSIKSTAWVHWPLAYVARPLSYADDVEEVRLRLWKDPREWLRRIFMVLTFSGTVFASLPTAADFKASFPEGVISIVEYAFLIDLKNLLAQPWRVVILISAVITLVLTWYGWELSLLAARSQIRADRHVRARRWAAALEYMMRVRDLCSSIFWVLLVVHAVLWLSPSTDWVTGYSREILRLIYGDFLPPKLRV